MKPVLSAGLPPKWFWPATVVIAGGADYLAYQIYTRGHAISGNYLYRDPLSHRYLAASFHAGSVVLRASINDLESAPDRHTTSYTQDGNLINIRWYGGTALAGMCTMATNHSTLICNDISLHHQIRRPKLAAALYTQTLGRFPWALPPALAFVVLWFMWRPWVMRLRKKPTRR